MLAIGNRAAMKWIAVKDQTPVEGQDVIYYFKHCGIFIGKYSKTDDGEDCFYSESGWLTDDVTHWLPLPEPPKEDSDGR